MVHSQTKKRPISSYLQVHGSTAASASCGQQQAAHTPVPPPLSTFVSGAVVGPPPLPVILAGFDFEGKEMIELQDDIEDLDQDQDHDQDHDQDQWTSFGEAADPITPFALRSLCHNTSSNQAESDVGGGQVSNDDYDDNDASSTFSADWAIAHEQAQSQFTKGSRYAEIIAMQKQIAEQIASDMINSDIERKNNSSITPRTGLDLEAEMKTVRASYDDREEGDGEGILAKLDAQANKRVAILQRLKQFAT
jgi:hypothetical protein